MSYECKRCFYKTDQKVNMTRHLQRKYKCPKNISSIFISDEDWIKTSLIKNNIKKINENNCTQYLENSAKIEKICTETLENSAKIEKSCTQPALLSTQTALLSTQTAPLCTEEAPSFTQSTLLSNDTLNIINKHINDKITDNIKNQYKCLNCDCIFTRKSSLRRHQNNICKNNNISNSNIENVNIENNNIENNTNNTINNNTVNNILNLNLNINNKLISFDNDWDISKLDLETKQLLFLSSIKFTKTMEKILENDANMNVFIEKNSNSGIVYKDKFEEMNINDIIDKSMEKLYKHLTQFYKDIKIDNEYQIKDEYLEKEQQIIENKYDDYTKNEATQKKVHEHILEIYERNKDKILTNYKNVVDDSITKDTFIGY